MRRCIALVALCLLACAPDSRPAPGSQTEVRKLDAFIAPSVEELKIEELLATAVKTSTAITPEEDAMGSARIDRMLYLLVEVKGKDGELQQKGGSAFVIGSDGTALTANHVVQGAVRVRAWTVRWATLEEGAGHRYVKVRELAVTVLRTAPKQDVALIRTSESVTQSPLLVRRTLPGKDERVFHFGTATDVADGSVTNPHATSMVPGLVVREVIEAQTAMHPGDSGGPLLDESGAAIGVCLSLSGERRGFFLPMRIALESLHYSPRP